MTGDKKLWMIMDKSEVLNWYANQQRVVKKSSKSCEPLKPRMYIRRGALEDPWLSMSDHATAIGTGEILYGENGFGGAHSQAVSKHKGASVYIRSSKS